MTATLHQHTACVRNFIDQIWNAQHTASLGDYLCADYVDHAYTPPDSKGLLNILAEMRQAFPDAQQTIEAITAQDDVVMCRIVLSATHAGTFRTMAATGNATRVSVYRSFRLHNGKIAEHWALLDTAGLLRQIGSAVSANNGCAATN